MRSAAIFDPAEPGLPHTFFVGPPATPKTHIHAQRNIFVMTEPNLIVQCDSRGIAQVILNRPHVLNAFDEGLIQSITTSFERLDQDRGVRVVVLSAVGRTFCAGADVAWMQRAAHKAPDENLADAGRFATMMESVARCSKPVVARVRGAAYGGGVGLVCAADVVIADTSVRFCVSEAKLGIIPAVVGPYLINAVGLRQAQRLALTCSIVEPVQALRTGLVHEVTDPDELDRAVDRCLADLLAAGPLAQGHIKELFGRLSAGPVSAEVQQMTAQAISRVRASEEARVGFESFVQKKRPPWAPPL